MIQVPPEDWMALELIERGASGYCVESTTRLGRCGFIRARAPDQFEITKEGWHALRQHRRVSPD